MDDLIKKINELEKELSLNTHNLVLLQTVYALNNCLEKKDSFIAEHQKRVAVLAVKIAEKLNYDLKKIQGVYLAALIHDIGKLGISSYILEKAQHLTEEEESILREHPAIAFDIISDIEYPWAIKDFIVQHHELLDGSGYPKGLSGKAILKESRIITVADMAEAICTLRPYKETYGVKEAVEELEKGKSIKYDKAVCEACISILEDRSFTWENAIPQHRLYKISN